MSGQEDEWEYYMIHDSIGVSHVMRKRKGELPPVKYTCAQKIR